MKVENEIFSIGTGCRDEGVCIPMGTCQESHFGEQVAELLPKDRGNLERHLANSKCQHPKAVAARNGLRQLIKPK